MHSPLFPIRELVRRTGVNASTLRAWERRHGLLKPQRTPTGHRLHSEADVRRVRRVQELLAQGLSLDEIREVLDHEPVLQAEAGLDPAPDADPQDVSARQAWQGQIQETLRAIADFSAERLNALYNEACALYPIDVVTLEMLVPVLYALGQRWAQRPSGVAEEHFFCAWLRNKLGARLHHGQGLKRGKPIILACLPDENHEIGLLIFTLGVLELGFRVIYLGANMPTRQIIHVVTHTHAQAVVLASRGDDPTSLEDIVWLAANMDTPIFVGSHISVARQQALLAAGTIPLGADIRIGLRMLDSKLSSQGFRVREPST
jgi:DNA-binding transcriptional MerR regulator/methylmalonyl-CoA mutase cobalamin-binding subunit